VQVVAAAERTQARVAPAKILATLAATMAKAATMVVVTQAKTMAA
jgi:hypothetical protein